MWWHHPTVCKKIQEQLKSKGFCYPKLSCSFYSLLLQQRHFSAVLLFFVHRRTLPKNWSKGQKSSNQEIRPIWPLVKVKGRTIEKMFFNASSMVMYVMSALEYVEERKTRQTALESVILTQPQKVYFCQHSHTHFRACLPTCLTV